MFHFFFSISNFRCAFALLLSQLLVYFISFLGSVKFSSWFPLHVITLLHILLSGPLLFHLTRHPVFTFCS